MLSWLIGIILFYAVGSLSFGYMITHFWGLSDPAQSGSGSRGATNVLRTSRRPLLAVLTLLGDALKAAIPLFLVSTYCVVPQLVIVLMAIACVFGHIFPIFFAFRGGKGVATTVGVLFAFDWRVGLIVTAVWVLTIVITRISSLGALVAVVVVSPIVMWVWHGRDMYCIGSVILSLMVLVTHHQNIRRLVRGEEK